MKRYFAAALISATGCLMVCQAQEVVPVSHGTHQHGAPIVIEGESCASGQCGSCSDCVRITDIKKTQHPVYSCKVKEICIPHCNPFAHLFGGNSSGCRKIEVHQLVKKYRTDEECVSKCVTQEEAAKHYEAEAKKAAEKAKASMPAPTPAPAASPNKLPAGAVSSEAVRYTPVTFGSPTPNVQGTPLMIRSE